MLLSAVPGGATTPPNGNGLESFDSSCGTITTTAGGAGFYVGGEKYALTALDGTITPTGGGESHSFTKTSGKRTGMTGAAITCTGSVYDDNGTFDFTATGVPVSKWRHRSRLAREREGPPPATGRPGGG